MPTRTRRRNMMTGFLQDLIDDTKGFVDDLLDRAQELEKDVRDTAAEAYDDKRGPAHADDVAGLRSALSDLTAKVDQLVRSQRKTLNEEINAMTKSELQAYAEEQEIAGVDQNSQTREDMLATIRRHVRR